MWIRTLIAIAVVFAAWQALDYLIHGVILEGIYATQPELWRPMDEMKMPLMAGVTAIASACFVLIYTYLVQPKAVVLGIAYGLIFGIGAGASMGYGTYAVLPIPQQLALGWFVGTIVETTVAGAIVGLIIKEPKEI